MKITLPKSVFMVLWVLVFANLLVSLPHWLHTTLNVVGLFLVFAHLAACFMFSRKIKLNHENRFAGYVQVLFFGVLHLNTLPDFKQ